MLHETTDSAPIQYRTPGGDDVFGHCFTSKSLLGPRHKLCAAIVYVKMCMWTVEIFRTIEDSRCRGVA